MIRIKTLLMVILIVGSVSCSYAIPTVEADIQTITVDEITKVDNSKEIVLEVQEAIEAKKIESDISDELIINDFGECEFPILVNRDYLFTELVEPRCRDPGSMNIKGLHVTNINIVLIPESPIL